MRILFLSKNSTSLSLSQWWLGINVFEKPTTWWLGLLILWSRTVSRSTKLSTHYISRFLLALWYVWKILLGHLIHLVIVSLVMSVARRSTLFLYVVLKQDPWVCVYASWACRFLVFAFWSPPLHIVDNSWWLTFLISRIIWRCFFWSCGRLSLPR